MYELIKINNEYYLLGNGEAYPYAYHIEKKEILKIDGVGEISGELFHSQGFNYSTDCKKIIATTDINLGIEVLDRNKIEKLLTDDANCKWEVEVDIKSVPDFFVTNGLRFEEFGHEIDRSFTRYEHDIKKIK